MRDVDPLRTAYRAATELFFQIGDMAADVAGPFLALSCEGRDLVRSSVETLCTHAVGQPVVFPAQAESAISRLIAETLRR
jgi:hypothetical protein